MINKFLLLLLSLVGPTDDPPAVIEPYRNTHQLIMVFAENNRSEAYQRAMVELSKDPLGLDSHDMLIFEVFERGGIHPDGSSLSEEEAAVLRNYFRVSGHFMIVILDKQLQELYRSEQPVSLKEIFNSTG